MFGKIQVERHETEMTAFLNLRCIHNELCYFAIKFISTSVIKIWIGSLYTV